MKKLEDYRSGNYIKVDDYKSFIPSPINVDWVWNDSKLNTLLSKANLELGILDGYASQIPNIDIFIQMHVKVEANKSSRIEGTRTTIDEDLSDIVDINPEKRDDWQEVKNYVDAVNYGFKRIKEIPISSRMIKELHAILLKGVRGEEPKALKEVNNTLNKVQQIAFDFPEINSIDINPILITQNRAVVADFKILLK